MDGVAPVAKMNQQRKRRFVSSLRGKWEQKTEEFDRNVISPGTQFMDRIHAYIRKCIRDKDIATPVYFSTSSDHGEGEHKIFSRIFSSPSDSQCIIHGLDADLIVLSLLIHKPGIVLMREPTGPFKDNAEDDTNVFMYLMVDQLRVAILDDLKTKYNWPIPADTMKDMYSDSANRYIEDYCVLCFILGNDFLPHAVTLQLRKNGYDKLLWCATHAYKSHDHFVLDNHSLNISFLSDVFQQLSSTEDEDLWKYNEEYLKKRAYDNASDPYDNYPLKHKSSLVHDIFNNKMNKWRSYYYKALFHTKLHDTSVVLSSCKLYVQGLLWTYRYYKRLPKQSMWYYPYAYPPTFQDLANYTGSITKDEEQGLWSQFTDPPHAGFVHPHVQLLCIMPPESAKSLPSQVRQILLDPSHPCAYMFPKSYPIETYMKYHLWECTPVLPYIDVKTIQKHI
jgi:5'-3' exoribonuclease 1